MAKKLDIETKYFTASGIASKSPCWLYSVIAIEASTETGLLVLRNGIISTAPIVMQISAISYGDGVVVFNEPVRFKHGLYLDFQTGLNGAFVQFKPDY